MATFNIIRQAVEFANLSSEVNENLEMPIRLVKVAILVEMKDRSTAVFFWYWSQQNNVFGSNKSGLGYYSDITRASIKTKSIWMKLKYSHVGALFGVGKWAIVCDS